MGRWVNIGTDNTSSSFLTYFDKLRFRSDRPNSYFIDCNKSSGSFDRTLSFNVSENFTVGAEYRLTVGRGGVDQFSKRFIYNGATTVVSLAGEVHYSQNEYYYNMDKYVSEPASTPTSISVPATVQEGESFDISWGTSSRATRYHLERSINGGAYVEIYQGTNRSYVDIALPSWNTIRYRVMGYNSDGYSGYRTSDTITVKHFPEFHTKIDGNLKVTDNGWIKVDGQLREIDKICTKIDNVLKEV